MPIILNVIYIIVNAFTGFYIKYFDVMYTTVSYARVTKALSEVVRGLKVWEQERVDAMAQAIERLRMEGAAEKICDYMRQRAGK